MLRHVARSNSSIGLPQFFRGDGGPGPAVDFLPESVGKVAEHPNIVAIKEATGDMSQVSPIREACEANGAPADSLLLLSGDDGTTNEFVLAGGDKCISVTANVAQTRMRNLMAAALKKDA